MTLRMIFSPYQDADRSTCCFMGIHKQVICPMLFLSEHFFSVVFELGRSIILAPLLDSLESKCTLQAGRLQSGFQATWRLCLYDSCCLALPACSLAHPLNAASRVLAISLQTLHWNASACVTAAISCIACSLPLLLQKSLFLIHPCSFLPQRIFSRWDVGAGTVSPGCRPPWEREAGSLHESFFSTGMVAMEVVHARAAKRQFPRVIELARLVSWKQADACVPRLSPLADGRPTSGHACRPSLHPARAFRLPFPKGWNRSCCTCLLQHRHLGGTA